MLKAKAKPQPEPQPSFAEQIRAARAASQAYIDAKVAELKKEHPALSVEWLRLNLYAVNHIKCDCKLALKLIEEEKK
jgi:hypothetical protein